MEVILLERIENLGQMGDVVRVKPGYARNYLLPQRKALRATDKNKKVFDEQRAQLEAVNLNRRQEASAVAAKMDGVSVILIRQAGEAGQLYGSVNTRDIATSVTESGYSIERQQVRLETPIKALGLYDIRVSLHPEVAVTVKVNVARSVEEAAIQSKTGHAIVGRDEWDEPKAAAAPAKEETADDAVESAESDEIVEADASDEEDKA